MNESKTQRTDAFYQDDAGGARPSGYEVADFARQLEIELNEARKMAADRTNERDVALQDRWKWETELNEARRNLYQQASLAIDHAKTIRELKASRDEWRKVATDMEDRIGCGCVDGPCRHCNNALAAFTTLVEKEPSK